MKTLKLIFLTSILFSCNGAVKNKGGKVPKQLNLESLAFEGISIDFQFNSKKPGFGSLFLLVGFENPNFPPESREFEKLQDLGFEQVDDYFGIKNKTEVGSDVKIWLFPIVDKKEVYHDHGPYDAIRLTYVIIRNTTNTTKLFKKVYHAILTNLDVKPMYNGNPVKDFEEIDKIINQTVQYCRKELRVEPGSDEALRLDW